MIEFAGAKLEIPRVDSFRMDAMLITLVASVLTFRFKCSVPFILAVCGLLGVVYYAFA